MDRFEKLELIVKAMMIQKEKEIDRAKNSRTLPYIEGLRHELIALHQVYAEILDIKNNGPSVSDEMIEKIWRARS